MANRSLSIKGKITYFKSLMISLLQFPCTSICTPARVFSELKKILTDFIWDQKWSKVVYNTLVQEVAAGGLKLLDFYVRVQVIRLNWVKFLWKRQDSLASSILRDALNRRKVCTLLTYKSNLVPKMD